MGTALFALLGVITVAWMILVTVQQGVPAMIATLVIGIRMSFIIEGLMYLWRGPVNLRFPDLIPESRFTNHWIDVGLKDILVVVAAIFLVTMLSLFINQTKLGKAMRATAQDRDASAL